MAPAALTRSPQSLIFVPEPYFNEPGYEASIGTPQGKEHSAHYNREVRRNTVRLAMVDMLEHPPAGFEDAVRMHFYLQQELVVRQVTTPRAAPGSQCEDPP